MSDSLLSRPGVDGQALAAFLGIIGTAVVLAFASVVIRKFLSRGRTRSPGDDNNVTGTLFRSAFTYHANGRIAEFVIVLTTISFIATVFWILLGWHRAQ
jgi:O-antigen ligase